MGRDADLTSTFLPTYFFSTRLNQWTTPRPLSNREARRARRQKMGPELMAELFVLGEKTVGEVAAEVSQ